MLWLPIFFLVPSLVAVMAAGKRAQAASGRSIVVERPGLWRRRALIVGPQVALLALLLLRNDLDSDATGECLLLGILLGWITPSSADAVLGESGVRRGWIGRRFEDLAEWRLTGSHLRFVLDGEWTSVPCPPGEQSRVRELLLESNAAGESRFQD